MLHVEKSIRRKEKNVKDWTIYLKTIKPACIAYNPLDREFDGDVQ